MLSDLNARLDNEFLFILNLTENYINNFENNPNENELMQKWLNYLCCNNYVSSSIEQKRLRNTVLCKLLSCMKIRKLTNFFLNLPPCKKLTNIKFPRMDHIEQELMDKHKIFDGNDDNNFFNNENDCQIYVSSKILDNNRGVCACIGIAPNYNGDKSEWCSLGGIKKPKSLNDTLTQNNDSLNDPKFYKHIIELIDKESIGLSQPGIYKELEDIMKFYLNENIESEYGNMLKRMSKSEQRTFLLSLIRTKCLENLNLING